MHMTEIQMVLALIMALTYKHFVADFLYQPPYQFMNKGTYGHWGGLVHSGQHVLLTAVILWFFPVSASLMATILIVEFLVHYHTDWAKMNLNKKMGWGATTHNEFWILMGADQLIHSLTYVWIAYMVYA